MRVCVDVCEKVGGEEKNSQKCFKGNVFWIHFSFVVVDVGVTVVVVVVVVVVVAAAAR